LQDEAIGIAEERRRYLMMAAVRRDCGLVEQLLDHGVDFHLNQSNPLLHEIGIGESLWAFTRKMDGRYTVAAELISLATPTRRAK